MKKLAIFLAAIALTTGVFAQPALPKEWFGELANTQGFENYQEWTEEDAERNTGIRRDRAPLAPATLLLLGLGGAVVGTKVVRNRRK